MNVTFKSLMINILMGLHNLTNSRKQCALARRFNLLKLYKNYYNLHLTQATWNNGLYKSPENKPAAMKKAGLC
jgi:hypothetical protein